MAEGISQCFINLFTLESLTGLTRAAFWANPPDTHIHMTFITNDKITNKTFVRGSRLRCDQSRKSAILNWSIMGDLLSALKRCGEWHKCKLLVAMSWVYGGW